MADEKDALMEQLAEVFHDAWWHWSESVSPDIKSEERVARWKEFWIPYDALDESTKDMDREWAEEAMKKIKPYLDKAKVNKEMVTKVEVDANRYPGISKLLQVTSKEGPLGVDSMVDDLATTLLTDAVVSTLEAEISEPHGDWDPQILEEMLSGIQYPGAELTETMPSYFSSNNFDGWIEYLPTDLIKKMIKDVDANWAGKATVQELYDFDSHAAHGLVMGLVGHGVGAGDDPRARDWLKERGVDERGTNKYYESPYDEASNLIGHFVGESKNE